MLCALIMAGGKGTRFWPLSTEEKPKQFLNLVGENTMIQMTVNRINRLIPIERIFISTGSMYVDLVKEQLPNIPIENIIIEPEGRNTAPCIALSSFIIKRKFSSCNIVVLPSDHLIKDEKEFLDVVSCADEYIENNKEAMVTLGMTPTRPEVGYGYIKLGESEKQRGKFNIIKVDSFVEKPNLKKAKEYLYSKHYLWNGGMFVWNVDNILNKINKYSNTTYEYLKKIQDIEDEKLQDFINNNYKFTESISIDYAVLEKSNDIYVIPSNFGWDDVGSWEALDRYRKKDNAGNVLVGSAKAVESEENLVISSTQDIVIEGLKGIYVIECDGKILVGKKSNVANVNALKNIL